MKRRLLDLVRCPACRERLALTVFNEETEPVSVAVTVPSCRTWCEARCEPVTAATAGRVDCRSCYAREIREGVLVCGRCQLVYPVIDGVPRLVRGAYDEYRAFFYSRREALLNIAGHEEAVATLGRMDPSVFDRRSNESFSLQWRQFEYDDHTWFKDDLKLRKSEFLQSLSVTESDLDGALVLDAGCGNGKLTASITDYGAEVVGMDLSESIVRAHANRATVVGDRAAFVHFVQGNIMEPPLAAEAFDHIHSSGVLHHTPSTERAFLSFLTTARPGANVYVQLYRTREAWVGIPNSLIRAVTCRLPPWLLYRLCWTAVPLHTALVVFVARLRGEQTPIGQASRRERALSMFDNYSPRYQYRYTPDQVRSMFEAAGLVDVRDVTLANEERHMVALVGRKGSPQAATKRATVTAGPLRQLVPNGAAEAPH